MESSGKKAMVAVENTGIRVWTMSREIAIVAA